MKKLYTLILAVMCFTAVITAQTEVTITHLEGEPEVDFRSSNRELTEGETITFTVTYKNVQPQYAGYTPIVRVRVLNNYTTIQGAVEGTFEVTTSDIEQTAQIQLTIPDVESDIATLRLQAIACSVTGTGVENDPNKNPTNVFDYAKNTFILNDNIALAINDVKGGLSNTYYASSKGAIVVGDDVKGDYSIYNLSGQVVLNGKVESQINVSSLASGMYILSCNGGVLKFAK